MRARLSLTLVALAAIASFGAAAFAQQSLDKLEKLLDEEAAVEPSRPKAPPSKPAAPRAPKAKIEAEPEPGYLGLYAVEINGRLVVESVRPGSPAERATIRPGDQILRIGGAPLSTLDEMAQMLEPLTAGTRISLLVKRLGRDVPLLAVLGERPATARVIERAPARKPIPAAEPGGDSLSALHELERLLADAPPAADEPAAAAAETAVSKRIAALESELKRLHARMSALERSLERAEADVEE